MRRQWLAVALVAGVSACAVRRGEPPTPPTMTRSFEETLAVPNDNRRPAGTLRDGVLEIDLVARPARWEGERSDLDPNAATPTIVDVLGFSEAGEPVTIPGPLIRVPQGTEVRVRVRNAIPKDYFIGLPGPALRVAGIRPIADDVLVLRGLRAGTASDDVVRVRRGEVVEVRYRADAPGTYLYWATPSSRPMTAWTGPDAQLTGAIIVDPAGVAPDPAERIFVITMLDLLPDSAAPPPRVDYFRRAINGRSWPSTERFLYAVGDTVRWRWINASFEFHPMHLHGFHYRLIARGDGMSETLYPDNARPFVVTEHMTPGSTFRMEWTATRPGNWIFHCHHLDHIRPTVDRDTAERAHDLMDVQQHALDAMGGLVLGMTVAEDEPAAAGATPDKRLRLIAVERPNGDSATVRGFALANSAEEAVTIPSVPGPPLLLARGETTEITVVNRLSEPTTIHWHGLELESVYDGVAGWSRTGSRIAPLVAPGDSFAVRITPPRAGTFIYHTHMDESDQLAQGMAGPFLVLEPGAAYDSERDRVFLIAGQTDGDYPVTINGQQQPPPVTLRVGQEYRLRFINISRGGPVDIALAQNGSPVRWRALAKDGADLPEALRLDGRAEIRTNAGETFDFLWTPIEPGEAMLSVRYERFLEVKEVVLRQKLHLR